MFFMARILLVEDDKNSSLLLKSNLLSSGYEVSHSGDGESALIKFGESKYDLCLLDIMLPKMDGLSLAREIRKKDKTTPFIFLSARGLPEDRVEGLRIGGEDYITKPFHLEELLLRIKIVLKRRDFENEKKATKIEVGDIQLKIIERELLCGERVIKLSSKETALFELFFENRESIIPRSEILKFVWGRDDYFTSKSLDVYLTKIRKILLEFNCAELYNIRGYGYRFCLNE